MNDTDTTGAPEAPQPSADYVTEMNPIVQAWRKIGRLEQALEPIAMAASKIPASVADYEVVNVKLPAWVMRGALAVWGEE